MYYPSHVWMFEGFITKTVLAALIINMDDQRP